MHPRTMYEVVMKMNGPIQAFGDSGEDAQNLSNLRNLTALVDLLLLDIQHKTRHANREEASMKAIGNHAMEFLKEVHEAYSPE